MKRLFMAALCMAVFASCGESVYQTEITTERHRPECGPKKRKRWERRDLKYELRFNGDPVAIVCGDTLIIMNDEISCVAVKLLERGHARLEMSMKRSRDNALLFSPDVICVGVAETDSVGYVAAVCRSNYGSGCGK